VWPGIMYAAATGRGGNPRYAWCVVIAAFSGIVIMCAWVNGLARARRIVDTVAESASLPESERRDSDSGGSEKGRGGGPGLRGLEKTLEQSGNGGVRRGSDGGWRRGRVEEKSRMRKDSRQDYPSAEHREKAASSSDDDEGGGRRESDDGLQLADVGGLTR
jgi:hypothetical protein